MLRKNGFVVTKCVKTIRAVKDFSGDQFQFSAGSVSTSSPLEGTRFRCFLDICYWAKMQAANDHHRKGSQKQQEEKSLALSSQ